MKPGLSVEQLIAALQRRSIPVPFEAGAFLVLEASERVVADPVLISAAELRITDGGELVIPPRIGANRPSPREACKALAALLGELLVCSAQSVPPMLLRLVEPGPGERPMDAAQLRDELEATLVPLNRAAMRRVLARLVREAKRALDEGRPRLSVHPHPADQEAELDAVLGGRLPSASRRGSVTRAEAADPASSWGPSSPEEENAELDAVLAGLDRRMPAAMRSHAASGADSAAMIAAESARREQRSDRGSELDGTVPPGAAASDVNTSQEAGRDLGGADRADVAAATGAASAEAASGWGNDATEMRLGEATPAGGDERRGAHPADSQSARGRELAGGRARAGRSDTHGPQPRLALGDQGDALDRFEDAAGEGGRPWGARVAWAAVLLVAALVGGYGLLGRDRSRNLVGLESAATSPRPAASPVRAAPAAYGILHVTSTPARAQVLVRVGKGPAIASKLPIGVVHEFVATRQGFTPSRAFVPVDAQWQGEGGERRYELALQLRETSDASKEDELGPARLPAALGTPSGSFGSVRIITSPPGADVYQLIGFTPDVAVENLPIEAPLELLVYLPDHEPKHVSVGRADWKTASGTFAANVHVTLLRRAAGRQRK